MLSIFLYMSQLFFVLLLQFVKHMFLRVTLGAFVVFFAVCYFASLNHCSVFCSTSYLSLLTQTFSFLHLGGVILFRYCVRWVEGLQV